MEAVKAIEAFPIESWPALTITQHALAGKAALGFAQMAEADAHDLQPPEEVLDYAQKMDHFAQKADMTRKFLERYLVGTELNRVDPITVPFDPKSVTTYPVPADDPSVMKGAHMPADPNSTPVTPALRRPYRADMESAPLLVLPDNRRDLIRSFIYIC